MSRTSFLAALVAMPSAATAAADSNKRRDTIQESISGVVAGATLTVTKTLVKYPLDTATVRLQMPSSAYSIWEPVALLRGSYRGVVPPLIANVPAGAVFFGVKDACKPFLRSTALPKLVQTSLAVGVAQIPYWMVRNPSEVVKTRQQAGRAGYEDSRAAYQAVFEQGWPTFYSGYWQNIAYAYPADVLKFVAYDALTGGQNNLSPAQGALAGAASTAMAQFLTTPLDVVRNRVMADSDGQDRRSYLEALTDLAQTEGLSGLFAGASPRVAKALLSGAIQFATYEETKQQIAAAFQRRVVVE